MIVRVLPSCRLLLVGFVAAACVYLFFLEPWGHDTGYHLQRLQDIQHQFGWGHLRAYFAENAADGKGLPVWIYYSQWIYWPAMFLASLGASPLVAVKLMYCLALVLCCLGSYRLLRQHADEDAAVFGALLFMTSSYVVGEIFQRSAYAEFLSVALLPLLLAAMHSTVLNKSRRSGTALVLVASTMILAHPLSFMNSACALAAYAVYLGTVDRVPCARFFHVAALFALALGLTAFFWLPAVIETRYVLGAEGAPTPLRDTFLTIGRYLNFAGVTTPGLVLMILTPVVAGSLLVRRPLPEVRNAWSSWPLMAGILVYGLLTVRISEPLYDALPLLASNLWAWRVLFPMTLLIVVFVTVNLGALPNWLRRDGVIRGLAGLAVLQAVALVLWNTATDLSLRPTGLRELQAGVAIESQRKSGFGINEYLPNPRALPYLREECRAVRTAIPQSRYDMSIVIAAADAQICIHVPRYWNTRYEARIDGATMPVYADASGEIVLVPAGRTGGLTLRFGEPGYARLATLLSGFVAILMLGGQFVRSRAR